MNPQQAQKLSFRQYLQKTADQQKYLQVQYYSDVHELLKVSSVVKSLDNRQDQEYLQLASGEEIPVESLVQVGSVVAPGHAAEDGFACAC